MTTKRKRSPSYPAVDLKTAVERTITFYEAEGFNETLTEVALQGWGYSSGSSNGYRTISALIQYGFIDDQGTGDDRVVFLTERGKTVAIDERENSQELERIKKEAALSPPIFKKLWEEYEAELPSDATLKYHLIRELEFNPKYVKKFIKIYKDTLGYSGLLQYGFDNREEDNEKEVPERVKNL